MIVKHYLNKAIRALIAGTVLYIGIITIGHGELFDRFYLLVLLGLITYSVIVKESNILGVATILFAANMADELLYLLPDHSTSKLLLYSLCGYILYVLKDDKITQRIAIPVFTLCVIAELYWYHTNYQAPQIYYYLGLLVINLAVRRVIYFRHLITLPSRLGTNSQLITLDNVIYNASAYFVIAIAALTLEYLIRHLSQLSITYVYYAYQYFARALLIYYLVKTIDYIFKTRFQITA